MYAIEKGVPLPPATTIKKYPWQQMVHGDSFLVPNTTRLKSVCSQTAMWTASSKQYKFSARLVEGGVRVWCTVKDQ